jgi:hypothetical protein
MVVSNVDYYYNTQRATLIVVPRDEEYNYWSPVLWIELGRALSRSELRHPQVAEVLLPRSTDSGTISWTFLGTIESSPSLRAWVLLVDWLLGLLPVG